MDDAYAISIRCDWPPYNIEKKEEDQYRITMTGAGFSPNEIELVQHDAMLLVTGQRASNEQLKPRRTEIGAVPVSKVATQDNQRKQINASTQKAA